MEDGTGSPKAVKVEEHSRCVILTYFQGDINSMVDAHFSRALSKVCKAKAPGAKAKKIRKSIKLEESSQCQATAADCYSESPVPPPERLLSFSPADDARGSWHSFPSRVGEASGLPSIPYSMSPNELSHGGQQYTTSLLNLLHTDRGEMGPGMASASKPDLHPNWTMPQGFRDAMDPAVSFDTGRRLDKKDLYWY